LVKLSEEMRNTLNVLVEDLKSQEAIIGIGLFGSWSRGDAVESSDVDLFVVDKRDFDYEYTERIEFDNLLIDLNYLPEKWVIRRVPPEIDQKIYEAEILYDQTQGLTRIWNWMRRTYWTHERVELRTESYLMDAYAYLSRATSAQNKDDTKSAIVYAATGLENILKILIEASMLPISNTHFIERLESSTEKLGLQEIFKDYIEVSRLSDINREEAEDMLKSLESIWNEVIFTVKNLNLTLEALHVKVRRNLNYYGKPAFLKGLIARLRTLIDDGSLLEAGHYIERTLLNMLENYAWLVSSAENFKFDYTILFSSLEKMESSKTLCENVVKILKLEDISSEDVESSLKKARDIVNQIRQKRKDLIRNYVKSSS